jgi:thiol-disulfide isomerase/thioredoxin
VSRLTEGGLLPRAAASRAPWGIVAAFACLLACGDAPRATSSATAAPGATAPAATPSPAPVTSPAIASPSGPAAQRRGDPPFEAPAGEPLGRIPLDLVAGLEDVDVDPPTLSTQLAQAAPASLDVSHLPAGTWLYGTAPTTRTDVLPFAVSSDRSQLWLDGDADGVLEPAERAQKAGMLGGLTWFSARGRVRRPDGPDAGSTMVPMKIGVHVERPIAANRLDAYRRGTFVTPEGPLMVALVDRTFRGWFSHPGRDAILVDVDRDGRFDASADSTERWRLGEPFPLGSTDAVVTAVGPFGEWVEVARSKAPARRIASLALGAKAPDFEVKDVGGRPLSLASLSGKWVLLDFWATWCGPCRAELPNLKRLHSEHPDVAIIGMSGDREQSALEQFTKAQGMDWPQVFASDAVQRTYRITSFPRSFLIAPDGTIAARDLRGAAVVESVARLKAARQLAVTSSSR